MLCLFSMGGNDGGFSVYVLDNVFTYGCNHVAESYYDVPASGPLPEDHHVLSVEFRPTGPADLGAIALPDYQPPLPCAGRIHRALVDVSGEPVQDLQGRIRRVLSRQ